MAYSTGSGTYTDLMAAVLAHAIADGWTSTGGNWPISKGNVRGVDWTSYTATEADVTDGGASVNRTQRYLRIGIGASTAAATAQAAVTTVTVPNAAYTITAWHIFSDPSLCDYIHVVFQFGNGIHPDCFSHFSFGEIDKAGMSYGSIAYATTRVGRGYAVNNGNGNGGQDWNGFLNCKNMWAGNVGEAGYGTAIIDFMTHSTNAPHPNGISGWPAWDTIVANGNNLWAKHGRVSRVLYGGLRYTGARDLPLDWLGWVGNSQPYSGSISLMPMPFIMLNGSSFSSRMRWMGVFPNVRKCRMEGWNPGDEVTYGAETWKLFPVLRSTDDNQLEQANKVTSGRAGWAYKKVV